MEDSQHGRTAHTMEGSMDHAERIAREAHNGLRVGSAFDPSVWVVDKVAVTAARLGIEHGERESAAKIADMKRVLEHYAKEYALFGECDSDASACLARNFPAPKPSLREAALGVDRGRGTAHEMEEPWVAVPERLMAALRDAISREEGKP